MNRLGQCLPGMLVVGLLGLVGLLAVACAAPAPSSAPASAPATAPAAPQPTTASAPAPGSKPPASGSFNVAQVFPAGAGRDLVLQNCTSCHTIVPIVMGKKERGQWEVIKNSHSGRVSGLSRDDVNTIFTYLSENFGPNNPEPQLPPELLESGSAK